MAKEPVVILGAGTMALEVADLLDDIGSYDLLGFAVDVPVTPVAQLLDLPIWDISKLAELSCSPCLIAGIFSPDRSRIIKKMSGYTWIAAIHPSASISKTARVGAGVVINRLVAIGRHAYVGDHVLINRGATIGHHTILRDYVTVGPGANIAGNCIIGPGALIGMGANIVQDSRIPAGAMIKAGMVVKG